MAKILAAALIQRIYRPELPYEYLYNPTGMEVPEIEAWLQEVEKRLDITITRVEDSLEDIDMLNAVSCGLFLWKMKKHDNTFNCDASAPPVSQ